MTHIGKESARRARAGAVSSKAGGRFTTYNSRTSCKTQLLAAPRFEHLVERVHALGPRPLAELLAEIAAATGEPALIADRLQAYADLDIEILRFLGGDHFPPPPLEMRR